MTLQQRLDTIQRVVLETNVYHELRYHYAYERSPGQMKGEIKFDRAMKAVEGMKGLREILIKVTRDEVRNMSEPTRSERRARDDEALRRILDFEGVEVSIEEAP